MFCISWPKAFKIKLSFVFMIYLLYESTYLFLADRNYLVNPLMYLSLCSSCLPEWRWWVCGPWGYGRLLCLPGSHRPKHFPVLTCPVPSFCNIQTQKQFLPCLYFVFFFFRHFILVHNSTKTKHPCFEKYL